MEGIEFGNSNKKVRSQFTYNKNQYIFPVTDPLLEKKYLTGDNGSFDLSLKNIYSCVSIGKPYKGYCYKFLSSLIEV
jgi:hypothetical protein